jgi:hypothetical protein
MTWWNWIEQSLDFRHHAARHHRRRRHHRKIRVFLVINGYYFELNAHRRTLLMEQLTVGHTDTMTIAYFDTNGQPMLSAVAPDSPPTWVNTPSTPAVDTFTVAADGSSAVLAAIGPGTDSITVSVTVAGKSYTATQSVTISAAPQVLGSVEIINSVQ